MPTFPDQLSNEVCLPENLIHNQAKVCYFDIINADENNAIIRQQLQARIHHAQPLVVAGQVLALFADDLAQPLLDLRVIDVIVINPALVSCVVGRINVTTDFDTKSPLRHKSAEKGLKSRASEVNC